MVQVLELLGWVLLVRGFQLPPMLPSLSPLPWLLVVFHLLQVLLLLLMRLRSLLWTNHRSSSRAHTNKLRWAGQGS